MSGMRIGGFIGSAVLAMLTGLAVLLGVSSPAAAAPGAPAVGARSAYVVDSGGTVHYGKRETRRVPVASLVKVMTAYVVLREARLTDTITISESDVRHAAGNDATTAGLKKGERLTVRDLLYGLMLPSGADAANALARRYGPGKEAFVAKMNRAARALGLADTRYTNADGLPVPAKGGYSTAVDQARLAQAALRNPTFQAVVGTVTHRVGKTAVHRAHTWRNSNKLLQRSDGVLGVKTGYTRAAGYCLLFAGERGGRTVVGVLLGDQSERRFKTAAQLLDYAGEQLAAG
ncbi:D-alanyl-D-alanine carboxypeptidase (penicillin-binding protein 5/6) [Nonomuraea pusilla]|uniref:D-alanyl-D-alanine carboxypeptidase (Penicillin-binding protein 5/6) n=2 Tax=Nonomuraea pusilla TaxID=46177 RepID=A0A1H8I5N4_9ACTN|nr:D-alanyl-D-alanine carboxypeptidase (penicillin-binding protein 5/6) [Nonomuraea pusilla]